jgi:hypothetical protein
MRLRQYRVPVRCSFIVWAKSAGDARLLAAHHARWAGTDRLPGYFVAGAKIGTDVRRVEGPAEDFEVSIEDEEAYAEALESGEDAL